MQTTVPHGPPGLSARVITPAKSGRRAAPRRALIALAAAFVASIPTSNEGHKLSEFLWGMSVLVAVFASCGLATWAEQWIYMRLIAVGRMPRIIITFFLPPGAFIVGGISTVVLGLLGDALGDNGLLAVCSVVAMFWFSSSAVGSLVIVVLDTLISALVPDFRSRIQLAVFSLLTLATVFTVGIYAGGRALGNLIVNLELDGKVTVQGQPMDPDQLRFWLSAEGFNDLVALGILIVAVALGLPAILSACGKLADAVMERLNPLRDAFEEVSQGKLDVRVEEGGSRELLLIGSGFNRMTESLAATLHDLDAKNRDLAGLNRATSRFVPFQFLELLRKSSIREIERGDQVELEISVLFSDIRGFTTMAEALGPRDSFALINRYLGYMEPEIHKEHGFINDVIGDGIMALFHRGADSAVRAALGMLRALEQFNQALAAEGKPPVHIGIGMNSGSLMLGTIGGRDRLSCTVIGDPANAAARVEGMTKLYGASLLIADKTRAGLADPNAYQMREIDRVQAVGKNESFALYEVLDGEPAALREQKVAAMSDLSAALERYRSGDFVGAQKAFTALKARAPDDKVLVVYLERCRRHLEHPPASWDGVTRLETK
jgi:class 3 adenylate cyclase